MKHHIEEEEDKLFPMLREGELDLLELGLRLAERRIALLNELAAQRLRPPRRAASTRTARRQKAQPRKAQPRKAQPRKAQPRKAQPRAAKRRR